MHSRSYRRRRRGASRMPRSWRRASRSAASRCGRGARARRKASWPANGRMPHCSRAPPRRRSRRRSPRATTASRSSSRGGSSCAPSPSPQPARRSACPLCRHPRSPPFPEMASMPEIIPEIALTRSPAHVRHGSNIGQPLTRRDGGLKVTGGARYAADQHPPALLYAVLAVSSIARGRVAFLDVAAAKAHPGVVAVITPANRPALAQDPDAKTNPFMFRLDLLQSDRVRYANQPIAVVVAETLEAATEGAALLSPRYDSEPARIGLDATKSFLPPAVGVGNPAEVHRGDVEAGLAAASKRIAATYETSPQYHNAMEPHASWRRGTATRSRSTRRARASSWRRGASRNCSGSRPTRSTFAVRSSAAASAPRASCQGRRFSASSPRVWWESRSSWCCAASRCTARWDTGLRRGRPCGWARTAAAS